MIIDCHGHYTTAPKALEEWRNRQIAGIKDPAAAPKVAELKISDDELRELIETNQLRVMKERGCDLTIFSPRASFMAHHIGDFAVSSTWASICNELCYRVSKLFPDQFHRRGDAAAEPGRRSEDLHSGTRALREGLRLRRRSTSIPIPPAATGRARR